jgi:hypothetical protein
MNITTALMINIAPRTIQMSQAVYSLTKIKTRPSMSNLTAMHFGVQHSILSPHNIYSVRLYKGYLKYIYIFSIKITKESLYKKEKVRQHL